MTRKATYLKALMEMTKGRFREFMREPSAFFFVILMPIVWMAILGGAFGQKKDTQWRIGVHPSAESVMTDLQKVRGIKIAFAEEHELRKLMLKGAILLEVSEEQGILQFSYDHTNPEAKAAFVFISNELQSIRGRKDVFSAQAKEITLPGQRYIDFLIPGLLAFSILSSSLFGTGMTIVVNRREQLLRRYLATPLPPFLYIVSHILGRLLVLCVEIAVILLAGYAMFGFHIIGSFWLFAATAALGALCFTGIAILCGSKTKNAGAYNGAVNLLALPMIIFSGIWFARSHLPDWLSAISSYLPLTALVDALRCVALEGGGIADVSYALATLGLYGGIAMILSHFLFRWE